MRLQSITEAAIRRQITSIAHKIRILSRENGLDHPIVIPDENNVHFDANSAEMESEMK